MSKTRSLLPDSAIRLATYRQLEGFISAFASGHINLLILVGAPGLAKSRTVRRLLAQIFHPPIGNRSGATVQVPVKVGD